MDFFKSISGTKDTTATTEHGGDQKSSSDLLSSAQLVADAAQSVLHNESDKVDKPRVAGAAADVLGAAKDYGKLGEDGVGRYVGQAEDYLQKYSQQSSTTTAAPATSDQKPESDGEAEKPVVAIPDAGECGADATRKSGSGEEEGKSPGDYLKMAQGFLGKN